MVKKGKDQSVISLDPIHHKIIVGSEVVELKPRTFALFEKLFEHKNQIVSVAALTDEVWTNVTVSPGTLKQRIFLLRKALEQAHIEQCYVQSVHGRGYRLVVRDEGLVNGTGASRRQSLAMIVLVVTLVIAAIYLRYVWPPYDPPPNNRVVFWSATQTESTRDDGTQWEQEWITKLSSSDNVIFVAAERDPTQSITGQARLAKAALVSVWTQFESDGQHRVRMQILEPKTASTLRSDLAATDDSQEMSRLLNAQADAIKRILGSGTLPLLTEALDNTDHPSWAELRNLAKDAD